MEQFRQLGGLALSKDMSEVKGEDGSPMPLHLTGGRNMLKRTLRGYRRRPGFGAVNVQSAAAIGIGTTNPIAAWPLAGVNADSILANDDGTIKLFDNIDSFDQLTKGFNTGLPTFGELGGFHVFSTGGEPYKYTTGRVPSRLGATQIFEGESDETWTGDHSIDTDNETSGAGCMALAGISAVKASVFSADQDVSASDSNSTSSAFFRLGTTSNWRVAQRFSLGENITVVTVRLLVSPTSKVDFVGNITATIQGESGGIPDGNIKATQTIAPATINALSGGEWLEITFSVPPSIASTDDFFICLVAEDGAAETGACRFYGDFTAWGGAYAQGSDPWSAAYGVTAQVYYSDSGGYGRDLYTNYPNTSLIKVQLQAAADVTEIIEGANTFIRFRTDANNYFEYLLQQSDFGEGAYATLSLLRGSRYGASGSDLAVVGTPDWATIVDVQISVEFDTVGDTVYFDNCFMISPWAPSGCSAVFVADGRAFAVAGRIVYYSEKWNPNVFRVDSYLLFPSSVIAIVEAGPQVLFLLSKSAWKGIPLSSFPDYNVFPLSVYGCVSPQAAQAIEYKGTVGAAWITQNSGVKFYDGENPPITISEAVAEIFKDAGSSTQNLDFTRYAEISMFFHHRWDELWIAYPSLLGETNLKYALILNCKTGEWAPLYEWLGDSNMEYMHAYRDFNDSQFKLLVTDSGGLVWHEGFVGSTRLDDTQSKDGYVDGSTTGNMVKGYVELPFMGSMRKDQTDKDQIFQDCHVKYMPATDQAFSLDFDYRLAAKGSDVDKDLFPNEEEVVMSSTWTGFDTASRSTTPANIDDVIERNVRIGADIIGHALSVRVGQIDTGGASEWELYGVKVAGYPRYGKR